jgi:hypothetical protein
MHVYDYYDYLLAIPLLLPPTLYNCKGKEKDVNVQSKTIFSFAYLVEVCTSVYLRFESIEHLTPIQKAIEK